MRQTIRAAVRGLVSFSLLGLATEPAQGGLKTWDGKHAVDRIAVTVAYFVPEDRTPLPDWRDRVDYYARRIERFHEREFAGQSKLTTAVHPEPVRSANTTPELRKGDANAIFFRTLREVQARLRFPSEGGSEVAADGERPFPILLVLSDVNWRPLDDFWRLKPDGDGLAFEGQIIESRHHPGAESGGARATYLADRGVGWGLVSGDGWRVPYVGSDCVVYHEGVGHAIGLPHPEPANGSVMSLAQYRGWISESWVDEEQKRRLGWVPAGGAAGDGSAVRRDLFSTFRVRPEPAVPEPGEEVSLKLEWPDGTRVKSLRVRVQTDLFSPWVELPAGRSVDASQSPPEAVMLGAFDRPAPVGFRVDAQTRDGGSVELWGYFQVRTASDAVPLPTSPLTEFARSPGKDATQAGPLSDVGAAGEEADLLARVDPKRDAVSGVWSHGDGGALESPKAFGARIELPGAPPEEYRLTVIAEPLDEPNGLILGQRNGKNRFLVLLNYGVENPASALENVDGANVGNNDTTRHGTLFVKGRPALVTVDVRKRGVRVAVDGRQVIDWAGEPSRLSLADYWATSNADSLFLGAYDCRYRFRRVGISPLAD